MNELTQKTLEDTITKTQLVAELINADLIIEILSKKIGLVADGSLDHLDLRRAERNELIDRAQRS
jgi:hypothetical protein